MLPLIIRAPLMDVSGYACFSRNIALALYRFGTVPGIMRMTSQLMSSYLPNSPTESLELEEMLKQKINNYDESVVLSICPAVTFNHCYGFDLGYTMTEVDKLSDKWIECCNKMDLVLVPGPWNEKVHKENGVKNVIGFAPALDTETYQPQNTDKYGLWNELNRFPFNFISTAHVMRTRYDRKGTKKLIRCFAREFSGEKDVGLILKCQILNHQIMDRIGFIRLVQEILEEEGRMEMMNKIIFMHRNQTTGELATMYSSPNVRCFVSPSSGEGLGLQMLEASSCGLPIMTTECSEHINYIPKDSLISIKHDVIDVQEEFWSNPGTVYPRGGRWVMADDKDVMSQMRKFYEENKTKPKEHIKADFSELSYSSFAKRFTKLLEGIKIDKKQFVVPEKVQLATGSDPEDGYFHANINSINTCQIDLIMDARAIMFPPNSVKKYLVIHLFEHLFDCDIASILMSINKTLIPGGEVEVHIPDIYWAIGELVKTRGLDREERHNRIKTVVLGTYEFHKNIITPERLEMFLRISGFEKIEKFDVVDRYDFVAKEDYDSNVRVSLKMRAFKPLLEP